MEQDYKKLFEDASTPMIILTLQGQYIVHNKAYRELMGYQSEQELQNFNPCDVSPKYQPNGKLSDEEVYYHNQKAFNEGIHEFEWLHKRPDGQQFLSLVRLEVNQFAGQDCLKASIFDRNEFLKIERLVNEKTEIIRQKNRFLETIFENDIVGVMVSDEARQIVKVNDRMSNILKCTTKDILFGTMSKFVFDEEAYIEFGKEMKKSFLQGGIYSREIVFKAYDGSKVWCKVSGRTLDKTIPADLSKGVIWIVDDITERKELEENLKIQYELAKDANPLTELPGNNSIKAEIGKVIANGESKCILYIDIDNFKSFNDYYGFSRGDDVLKEVADILKDSVKRYSPEQFFIGNIGGDDFVMIVDHEILDDTGNSIIKNFDENIKRFYNKEDLEKGWIEGHSREGFLVTYPIMSVSIAATCIEAHSRNELEVIDICTMLKNEAKKHAGSTFIKDRRS